jgi:hypothetical protein
MSGVSNGKKRKLGEDESKVNANAKSSKPQAGKGLTVAELRLTARLLETAATEFSNHRCNEFTLKYTKENVDLLTAVNTHTLGAEDSEPIVFDSAKSGERLDSHDHILMDYIAHRIRQTLHQELHSPTK